MIKTLRLNNLFAKAPRHPPHQSVFHLIQMAMDPHEILDEFVLPQWTTAFTCFKFHELEQAAKEAGVNIKGSVLDAVRIQAEFNSLAEMVSEWDEQEADETE